jgi:LmbE family N-acetylglucosaminyl deacetylase
MPADPRMTPSLELLTGRYDSLYLSPHSDDFALSCAARLASEVTRGSRILVVTLFGGENGRAATNGSGRNALAAVGAAHLAAGFPDAASRHRYYSSFRALSFGRHPEDDPWVARAARLLAQIADRVRPREIYAPLAVGGHIDHRLAHEAALLAFESREGRNVFLYEDRPETLVPGAVRIRLAQVGAHLPPAAAGAVDEASLARFLMQFHLPPSFRGDLAGIAERVRSSVAAARSWLETRSWRPGKGLGLRVQPVIHRPDPEDRERMRRIRESVGPAKGSRPATAGRLSTLLTSYTRKIGGDDAERYWLLLPHRDPEGRVALAPAAIDDAVPR